MTAGSFVIFRCTEAGDNEDRFSGIDEGDAGYSADKVEFNGDAAEPDAKSWVSSLRPVLGRTPTENPAPFLEIVRKPDTGFGAARYALDMLFDRSAGIPDGYSRIKTWITEAGAIAGKFRNGRFGIRDDYLGVSLTPDNDAGFKLASFEPVLDMRFRDYIRATLTVEFSGDVSQL